MEKPNRISKEKREELLGLCPGKSLAEVWMQYHATYGNSKEAAQALGISEQQFNYHARALGLQFVKVLTYVNTPRPSQLQPPTETIALIRLNTGVQ